MLVLHKNKLDSKTINTMNKIHICKKYYQQDFTFPQAETHCMLYNNDFSEYHYHDYWEFFLICNGSITHKTPEGSQRLQQNDGYLMHPENAHCFFSKSKDYQHLNIAITDNLFRQLTNLINSKLYEHIQEAKYPIKIVFSDKQRIRFLNDIKTIQLNNNKDIDFMRSVIIFMFTDLLKDIFINLEYLECKVNYYPDWLNDLFKILQNTENISVKISDVCRLTNFSRTYLAQQFKKYTGETLQDYMIKQKIAYAAGLLQTTDKLIINISSEVGYDSLSHFNRIFKRFYGLTPSEYRKKTKKEPLNPSSEGALLPSIPTVYRP